MKIAQFPFVGNLRPGPVDPPMMGMIFLVVGCEHFSVRTIQRMDIVATLHGVLPCDTLGNGYNPVVVREHWLSVIEDGVLLSLLVHLDFEFRRSG